MQPQPRNPEEPGIQVEGKRLEHLPEGLYVPPDALEIFLDRFSGPLDLLLWLIRRNRMDIRNIPVAEVTSQYLAYLEEARHRNLELASDYLLMAAWLAEIKARILLPVPPENGDVDVDPREELARRLELLAEIQGQAGALDALPRLGRDFWLPGMVAHERMADPPPNTDLAMLVTILQDLGRRRPRSAVPAGHQIASPAFSLRQRMGELLALCQSVRRPLGILELLPDRPDRMVLGISLLAVLELIRQRALRLLPGEDGNWEVAHD